MVIILFGVGISENCGLNCGRGVVWGLFYFSMLWFLFLLWLEVLC